MTVFINDPRDGDAFVDLRKGSFADGNYPASAMISVSHLAVGILIEIQGVASSEESGVAVREAPAPRDLRSRATSSSRSE